MPSVLKEVFGSIQSLKKVLLTFGGVGGVPVTMLSSAQSDSNSPRTWNVEFSDGRLVNITGEGTNCEGETCGDYFALNGYDKGKYPDNGSFATLGIKKSISKVNGFGNNNPEIRGGGAVSILFCSTVNSGLNSGNVKNETWGANVCQNNWVIPRDGRKNGDNNTRNGKGWYVIGFIWDENTQYFGFIKEANLIGKVLNEDLKGKGIDVEKGKPKTTGLFASTFTSLLDTNIEKVGCLHLNGSTGSCSGWNNWQGVITMPMGYIGSSNMADKKLSEAALVVVPVDQIRVKDGKLRIGRSPKT